MLKNKNKKCNPGVEGISLSSKSSQTSTPNSFMKGRKMIIGRIKIWTNINKSRIRPYYPGLFGQMVVRALDKPGDNMYKGVINISSSMKALKDFAEKEGWIITDSGFVTYWFWRFFLTIRTQSYLLKNPW